MLDLALGSIIGTAFASVVDGLAGDVIMQFVAAIFGSPTSPGWRGRSTARRSTTARSLTVVVNFLLLALVPFGSVKLLKKIGLGNFRSPHSLAALGRRFANAL
jgi:large conductance mechanosensitive channel